MFSLDKKIGVVVAEDEVLIRKSIVDKIKAADNDFEVLAEVGNGLEAMEAVRRFNPQVVVTDIKMPEMDGIALARALSLGFPTIKVVVLSGYSDFSYMQQAIRYGVTSYLLKPVENEALAEILFDLKNSIISYRHMQNRTVIYSANYSGGRGENCRYAVLLVCVGNLCYDVEDDLLEELYDQQQTQIDWHTLLDELFPDAIDWYLADEEEKNQKLICYSVSPEKPADYAALAKTLQARLAQILYGVPISVCTARGSFIKEDVWMCAQRIRNILKQKVVPAQGNCFLLEQDEICQTGDNLSIIKMHISDNLRVALEQKDMATIRAELQLIFKYMLGNHFPQQDWQRVMLHILRMMEFASAGFVDLQTETLRCVSRMNDETKCVAACVTAMMACLDYKGAAPSEDADTLARRLKNHLDDNYLVLENLEDLTQAFPYSYAYLSRIFRKEYDVSMSRYITTRRIDLAKRLIQNNESLSMIEIGHMAGFADSYYFSRVFKSVVGCAPTEYKNKIILKG